MKAISIYTITRNQNTEYLQKLERQLSGRDVFLKIREWELDSMKALVSELERHMQAVYALRFFYSFQIPRLGKEFDLLQIKEEQILNLELKSGQVSDEAIRKQLIQNRYYLAILGRPVRSYTYISSQNRLVRLTNHDHIVEAEWEQLCAELQEKSADFSGNLEDLFQAEWYLISPLTQPERFLKKEYFLTAQQKDIERQASKFESRISDAPKQEKEFMTISRQQEIKATLYIMLLQKREENAITLAATANNGRIVEEPLAGKDPVAPKKLVFLLAAFVVGLFIPVGIIFVVELLKYKIENRGDVEQLTNVPILGELPLCGHKSSDKGAIVVRENKNDMMEETFRGLRTNLLFMLRKDQKVILFSSTQPGEGKSFVTGNLAVSLAYLGKKVVVVGMDIRKPDLNKVFDLSKRQEGISNYLMDPEDKDLFDLVQPSGISPNLDILLGGTIPPNPTELVARDTLEKAIEQLKSRYDYVLLDTAPIGMVTDTAIISRVADMCVYVCRADVTLKAAFCYINVLRDEHKFDKLAVVVNGIDLSKRKNTYGYGYGKKYGYGYGKHYGYGYGYGYGFEAENKKRK